jgi:hypothetical protein
LSNFKHVIGAFAKNYFDDIVELCSYNPYYEIILEVIGVYDVIEKSVSIFLQKRPSEIVLPELHDNDTRKYFLAIVKNVLRNYTRDKTVKSYILSNNTIDIDKIGNNQIVDFIYSSELVKGQNDTDLDKLYEMTEKLYDSLYSGNIEKCQPLIRYYRKLIDVLKNDKVRLLYEANLHLFNANYFSDIGKLNLSKKHAINSIELYNKSGNIIGHQFIAGAYNLLGAIALNQKNYSDGDKIFSYSISKLEQSYKSERTEFTELALAKTRMLYGMYAGNIPSIPVDRTFKDSLEIDLPRSDMIFKTYIQTYLNIDKNKFSQAINSLNDIGPNTKTFIYGSALNKVRYYVALAESFSYGFTAKDGIEKERILFFCEKALFENKKIAHKYFDAIIKMIMGFAKNDFLMINTGLSSLKDLGYAHYYEWYRKKFLNTRQKSV